MARDIATIQTLITNKYVAEMAAIGVTVDTTNWSVTNLTRLFFYVLAFCQNILEQLFDLFKLDVNATIALDKPHRLNWYVQIFKSFQYGYTLVDGEDYYDNSSLTDSQIAASKIIAACEVTEGQNGLDVKVARDTGDLAKLTAPQLAAFTGFANEVKDAGVFLNIVNEDADSLQLNAGVVYNPQVLDANGVSILNGDKPVETALNTYLKNIRFNGEFAPQDMVDAVQKVDGVVYFTPTYVGVRPNASTDPYNPVQVVYVPLSGYLRFLNPADLTLTYTPHV